MEKRPAPSFDFGKRFRKATLDKDEDSQDEDYDDGLQDDLIKRKSILKHIISSDEEHELNDQEEDEEHTKSSHEENDDETEYNLVEDENDDKDNSGSIPIIPFSMREEEGEGQFDAEGTFVPFRDPGAKMDAWLEGTTLHKHAAKQVIQNDVEKIISEEEAMNELTNLVGTGQTPNEALKAMAGPLLTAEQKRKGKVVPRPEPHIRARIERITDLCQMLITAYDKDDIYQTKL